MAAKAVSAAAEVATTLAATPASRRKNGRKQGRKEGAERKEEWKKVDLVFARLTVAMVATYKVLARTRRSQQHR